MIRIILQHVDFIINGEIIMVFIEIQEIEQHKIRKYQQKIMDQAIGSIEKFLEILINNLVEIIGTGQKSKMIICGDDEMMIQQMSMKVEILDI